MFSFNSLVLIFFLFFKKKILFSFFFNKDYLIGNGGGVSDDLASFRSFGGVEKKKSSSVWLKIGLVAGLLAVFGPYLARRLFNSKPMKRLPPRQVSHFRFFIYFVCSFESCSGRWLQFTITRPKQTKNCR